MKKIKYKKLISKSTLQSVALGFILAIIIVLLSFDAPAFAQSNRTMAELFRIFPGMWGVVVLPLAFALMTWYIARQFGTIIKRQTNKLLKEAGRTKMVLSFIENLRQDKLDEPLTNEDKKDPMTQALLNLREFMVQSKTEQERRRVEEEQRTWVTQGLAQFGEILRKSNDNLEEFSYNIIRYLVNYMKINQGGVFLLNQSKNGDKYFEMTACVAFDRRK